MKPIHFPAPADFRRWLEKHHATASELHVGFYKKSSGKPGMVYKEALDEALCFGWIDGLVRSIDAERYQQRFTPRKPGSIWSNINVGHVARLTTAGKMQPAGLAAFAARSAAKTGIYSFEQARKTLPPAFAKKFRAHAKAWTFFNAQPAGYRHRMLHKIVSPKQPATRERWLERVIAASIAGKRVE